MFKLGHILRNKEAQNQCHILFAIIRAFISILRVPLWSKGLPDYHINNELYGASREPRLNRINICF